MSALTSLLVRDSVVSVRKIEEAIQRQVISGGDLEGVLLEMGAVAENTLAAYRAALYGLLPATRDEAMKVPREIIRLVPREVAEQYRLLPLWAESRTLMVAVTTPLSPDVDEQLGFLLGHTLVYRIVTDVRLAAALGHHYGSEVSPRHRRLADKLRQADAGKVPYVAPAREEKVDPEAAQAALPRKTIEAIDWDEERDPEEAETAAPSARQAPRSTRRLGAAEGGPEGSAMGAGGIVGVSSRPPSRSVPPTTASRPPRAPSTRPVSPLMKRLRGPLTAKAGVELLNEATSRDDILDVFFAFARQFFDYTAVFVVHEEAADGRDSDGPGATSEDVSRMAIPLDVPGTFATVRDRQEPVVADLLQGDLDAIVARDLGRALAQPALVAPVTIRKRAVLMLYGDRDGESFGLADMPELIGFLPRVSDAFERVILRKKRQGYAGPEQDAESRGSLKAVAGKLAGLSASPGDARKAGAYRASAPSPEPDLEKLSSSSTLARSAEREAATPAAQAPDEPEPEAEPATVVAEPTIAVGAPPAIDPSRRELERRATTRWRRRSPLEVLRIPRSAPPPPLPEGEAGVAKITRPDGAAAALRAARSPHLGDEPEVSVEPVASDDPELAAAARAEGEGPEELRPGDGTYRVLDAVPEVLGGGASAGAATAGTARHGDPPAGRRRTTNRPPRLSRRSDPRREEEDGGSVEAPADYVTQDVVRLPRSTPVDTPVEATGGNGAAERPPKVTPQPPSADEPTVIVDMGATIESLVEDLIHCGPEDEGGAVDALLHVGEASLPALVQRFPGVLWFDRRQPHRRLPRGRDISAAARAMLRFGDRAVPYLASLIGSRDTETRFYATLLASELVRRELLLPLSERIFDEDQGTRLLALDVLRHFARFERDMEEVLKGVRVEARVDRNDPVKRLAAIRGLGELRDARAVDLLVSLLEAPNDEVVEAAHRSLVLITRQDFGDSLRKWQQWLDRNQGRHRIEWLIDALLHGEEPLRAAAAEELKALTQEYYGYHPASPKKDREIAQKKYRIWWEDEGRRRFVG